MNLVNVGIEKELNLIDENGFLQNRSDEVLSDPRNPIASRDTRRFVYESSLAQVEYNSPPSDTIDDLHFTSRRDLLILDKVARDLDIYPVSVSDFNAGVGEWRGGNRRYEIYPLLLGERRNMLLNKISGVHAHFSIDLERTLDQFWLLTSLDPLSYAITSTSPINHDGRNGLSCHRVNQTRYVVFEEFPLHAQLQQYPESLEELARSDLERFRIWAEKSVQEGLLAGEFEQHFVPDNTGYLPIRLRPDIGSTGTFEVRTFDTSPLDVTMSAVALYKGCQDRVFGENIPVSISDKDGFYDFSSRRVVVPNYDTLLEMERDSIERGMESDNVANYLQHVLEFSEKGLSSRDSEYLQPVRVMLLDRKNPSSRIMQYMRSLGYQGEQFSPEQCAHANIIGRRLYEQGLARYN